MITKEMIIQASYGFHYNHRVTDWEVQEANRLKELIEARDQTPTPGDIVICNGPGGVKYQMGHLEYSDPTYYSAICTRPMTPFVFVNDKGVIYTSTSGGYWFSLCNKEDLVSFGDRKEKMFHTWGRWGARADGAFYFMAEVNVWSCFSEDVFY